MQQICNHDCFNCPFPDCIEELASLDELSESKERDKAIQSERQKPKKYKRSQEQLERNRVLTWWYYQQHPEKRRAGHRKWREENREYDKIKKHAYYVANLERITEQHRLYREQHRDALREYYYSHRDEINARRRERRRQKKLAARQNQSETPST